MSEWPAEKVLSQMINLSNLKKIKKYCASLLIPAPHKRCQLWSFTGLLRLAHLLLHPTSILSRSVPQLSSFIHTQEAVEHSSTDNTLAPHSLSVSHPSPFPAPPPSLPNFPLVFIQQTGGSVGTIPHKEAEPYLIKVWWKHLGTLLSDLCPSSGYLSILAVRKGNEAG